MKTAVSRARPMGYAPKFKTLFLAQKQSAQLDIGKKVSFFRIPKSYEEVFE
jgi:hypothetical protein